MLPRGEHLSQTDLAFKFGVSLSDASQVNVTKQSPTAYIQARKDAIELFKAYGYYILQQTKKKLESMVFDFCENTNNECVFLRIANFNAVTPPVPGTDDYFQRREVIIKELQFEEEKECHLKLCKIED